MASSIMAIEVFEFECVLLEHSNLNGNCMVVLACVSVDR